MQFDYSIWLSTKQKAVTATAPFYPFLHENWQLLCLTRSQNHGYKTASVSNIWKSQNISSETDLPIFPLSQLDLKQKFVPFLLLPQDTNTFIKRRNSNIPIPCSQVEAKKEQIITALCYYSYLLYTYLVRLGIRERYTNSVYMDQPQFQDIKTNKKMHF